MVTNVEQICQLDETQLVHRSLAGDRGAFEEIVRRNLSPVEATAFALTGDPDDSEDVAQEVFVAAWQKLRQLQEPGKLRGWLCAMARNLARTRQRRQGQDPLRRAGTLDDATDAAASPAPSPSEAAVTSEQRRMAWEAMADIPEDYRLPLVLFYREGQSVREVASALDLGEDTVRQRLSRGRAMLRTGVARMVEDTLQGSRPGPLVVAGIMAGIGAAASHATAAGTLAAAAAKGGAAMSVGSLLGAIGGAVLGPVVGIAGGVFGARASLRQARTPGERREIKRLIVKTLVLVVVWIVCLGGIVAAGIFRLITPGAATAAGGVLLVAYLGALFLLILRANARIRKSLPATFAVPDRRPYLVKMSENMRANPRQWFFALLGSYGGSIFGSVGWLLTFCAVRGDALGFAATFGFALLLTAVGMWCGWRWPGFLFLHFGVILLVVAGFTAAVAWGGAPWTGSPKAAAPWGKLWAAAVPINGVALGAQVAVLTAVAIVLFVIHSRLRRQAVAGNE